MVLNKTHGLPVYMGEAVWGSIALESIKHEEPRCVSSIYL